MTSRSPVCDGCDRAVARGANYATVLMPGRPDRHLCTECVALMWLYIPWLSAYNKMAEEDVLPGPQEHSLDPVRRTPSGKFACLCGQPWPCSLRSAFMPRPPRVT